MIRKENYSIPVLLSENDPVGRLNGALKNLYLLHFLFARAVKREVKGKRSNSITMETQFRKKDHV